ncbi:hypothetical protein [Microbispora sp. CA-102843]|uniref:hypothetical protein n=1 Tax=Microbispora sp. CA-102843 TaxID=3239952 RepID=UPI003D925455
MTDQPKGVLGPALVEIANVRADVQQLADRLAAVERTATDQGARLTRLDGVDTLVTDLVQRVADLIASTSGPARAADPDDPRASHRRPWAALVTLPAEQSSHREDLAAWVETVLNPQYGPYLRALWPSGAVKPAGPGHDQVPPCWPKHNAACNELWTLFVMWWNAYADGDAKLREIADWHDRLLPGALGRLPAVFRECGHITFAGDITTAGRSTAAAAAGPPRAY